MKTIFYSTLTTIAMLGFAFCAENVPGAETNALPRIGTYDSRAVAYAWFWSAKHQKELNGLMQSARAAGDTNRFAKLGAELREHQAEMHREVFSAAPATGALADIKDHLPEIQKTAGVIVVSKWDEATLKKYPGTEQVDVTDRLVRKFITPTPEQQKVLSEMKTITPLPLEQCEELIRKDEI